MHDFRKRLLSTCALLLMASVAFAANSGLLEQRADRLLAESEELAAAVDVAPDDVHVSLGPPAGQIVDTADANDADLIVIGKYHAPGLVARVLIGGITSAVIQNANCSVLTVPV